MPCCDILILTTTKAEIEAVLAAAGTTADACPKIFGKSKTYFDLGTPGGAQTFAVRSEMGTATAGGSLPTMSEALEDTHPSTVIAVGIAFGIDSTKQEIGQILVSQKLQDYELQRVGTGKHGTAKIFLRGDRVPASDRILDRLRTSELEWTNAKVHFGLLLSGQKLIDNVDYRDSLNQLVPEAIGGEMEGTGVYVACRRARVDWIIVKAICDWADGEKRHNKSERQLLAAQNAARFVFNAINAGGLTKATDAQIPLRTSNRSNTSGENDLPDYRSRKNQRVSEELQKAVIRLQRLASEDASSTILAQARSEIIKLRRELRAGGHLRHGDVLGDRFLLLERLGVGGFATVWKARDSSSNRIVAVKVLHGQHADDTSRKERFFRGAREMARLKHVGIVQMVESEAEDDGFFYFVMEFIDGADLRHTVLEETLSIDKTVDIVLNVGKALTYAHGMGCVHRDIKPANILLDDDLMVKLTDFDLVHVADSTGGTRTGALGTFLFSAPEALYAANTIDVRADVYSLGMTTMFAIYGDDLPASIMRDHERIIDELECSAHIKHVLRVATRIDIDERYATVEQFCSALLEAHTATTDSPAPTTDAETITMSVPRSHTVTEGRSLSTTRYEHLDSLDDIDQLLRLAAIGRRFLEAVSQEGKWDEDRLREVERAFQGGAVEALSKSALDKLSFELGSNKSIGDYFGVSPSTVSRWFNGTPIPSQTLASLLIASRRPVSVSRKEMIAHGLCRGVPSVRKLVLHDEFSSRITVADVNQLHQFFIASTDYDLLDVFRWADAGTLLPSQSGKGSDSKLLVQEWGASYLICLSILEHILVPH